MLACEQWLANDYLTHHGHQPGPSCDHDPNTCPPIGDPMTTYAMPDPPPVSVTTLWDADGGQWCRLDDLAHWVPCDCLGDEPSITANVVDWSDLVYEYGPLSDTAPQETS